MDTTNISPETLLNKQNPESPSLAPNIVETYDENKNLTQKATYVDSILEGEFLVFNPQGTLLRKLFYQQGKLQGEAFIYNDDGFLTQKLIYDQDLLNGILQIFNNNIMIAEIPYVKGLREGISRTFSPNGQLQSETTFQADKEEGPRTIYNPESGAIIRKEMLSQGLLDGPSLTFYPHGTIMMQQTFKKDLLEGISSQFNEKGDIQNTSFYQKGILANFPATLESGKGN